MSERRRTPVSTPQPPDADLETEVNRVADALYALKPDDFAAARDAEVRSAREAGQPALAREIGKLRKPSQSAWLVNLLWRDQQAVMEQLFELAQELTQAQADAAGSVLRELTAQRRQLETALMRRAVELGAAAGVRVSDSVAREAQETLSAALALPEVAAEVRSGHLVKPSSYAGFGAVAPAAAAPAGSQRAPIDLDAARARRASDEGERSRDDTTREPAEEDARRAAAEAEARRAAEEEARRAELERRLGQARREVQRATTNLADAAQAAEDAHARAGDLRQQLDTLRRQLARVEAEASSADEAAAAADQQRAQADAALAQAKAELEDAEAAIDN
ncbi:MAG: hypothetical protein JOZ87_17465 [Chloroflexi bacterium]|nr:hypothetical protein [Chloroflexota bacterium]